MPCALLLSSGSDLRAASWKRSADRRSGTPARLACKEWPATDLVGDDVRTDSSAARCAVETLSRLARRDSQVQAATNYKKTDARALRAAPSLLGRQSRQWQHSCRIVSWLVSTGASLDAAARNSAVVRSTRLTLKSANRIPSRGICSDTKAFQNKQTLSSQ